MPKSETRLQQAKTEIEAVNEALRNGAPPASVNPKVRSACQIAADDLGADRRRFIPRVGTPNTPGKWEKEFGLVPNWSLWLSPPPEKEDTAYRIPEGLRLDRVAAHVDAQGNLITQRLHAKRTTDVDWPAIFREAFAEYEGKAEPAYRLGTGGKNLLNFIPCNDWHINMLAWEREVAENWDLKIAEAAIGDAIQEVIRRTHPAEAAVVLGGGDLLHADTNENRTAKSNNVLDADGRHEKALEAAQRLKVLTIDAALLQNEKVIVRILKGNHDEYSSVAIAHFLAAWYRNEPRVTVDLDASLFWWHRFGKVFLGATHGHTVKMDQMPMIMAHRRAEDWGKSKFRYVHCFHVHHKSKLVTEGQGVICESHQAPIPQDSWHYGSGYLSGRSVQTITYHRNLGELRREREPILDAGIDLNAEEAE